MLKKVFKFVFIALLAFSLVGVGVSTSLAKPPADKASKSQACENASDQGKENANPNSALGDCAPEVTPAAEPPARLLRGPRSGVRFD